MSGHRVTRFVLTEIRRSLCKLQADRRGHGFSIWVQKDTGVERRTQSGLLFSCDKGSLITVLHQCLAVVDDRALLYRPTTISNFVGSLFLGVFTS